MDDTLYLRAKHGERGDYRASFTTDGFDRWASSTSPAREGQMEKMPDEEVNTTMQGGVFGFKLPSAKSMKKAVGKYGKSALALIDEYSPDISAKARKYAEEGLAMADKYAPGLAKHLQEEVGMAGGYSNQVGARIQTHDGHTKEWNGRQWVIVGGALKVRLPKKPSTAPKKPRKTHGPVVHAGPRHVAPHHVPLAVRAASALGRYHAAKSGDHEYSGDIGDALSQAQAMEMAMHGGLKLGKLFKKAVKGVKKVARVAKAVAPHALEAYEAYHEARAPRRRRHAPSHEDEAEMEHEAEMEEMHGGLKLGKLFKKAVKGVKKVARVAKAVAPHALEAYEAYHEARAPRRRRSRHAPEEEEEMEAEMEEMHGGLKLGKLFKKAMKVGKKAVRVAKAVAPHALEAYEAYHEARAPRRARRSRHAEEEEEMEHEAEMEAMHGGVSARYQGRLDYLAEKEAEKAAKEAAVKAIMHGGKSKSRATSYERNDPRQYGGADPRKEALLEERGFVKSGGLDPTQDDMARMANQKKGGKKKPSARGAVVSQVMRERGVSLPEASRIVKAEGLY